MGRTSGIQWQHQPSQLCWREAQLYKAYICTRCNATHDRPPTHCCTLSSTAASRTYKSCSAVKIALRLASHRSMFQLLSHALAACRHLRNAQHNLQDPKHKLARLSTLAAPALLLPFSCCICSNQPQHTSHQFTTYASAAAHPTPQPASQAATGCSKVHLVTNQWIDPVTHKQLVADAHLATSCRCCCCYCCRRLS